MAAPSSCPFSRFHSKAIQPSSPNSGNDTANDGGQLDLHGLPSTSSSDSLDSLASSTSTHMHQAWQLRKPVLKHDTKLTRRQLRQLGRTWSLSDVAQRKYVDNGWIAVDGKVYDITEHIATHPGWDSGCRVTEVLSIIAHLGQDCSQEFHDIHRSYPVAYRQLAAYYIGELETDSTSTASS